MSQLSLRRTLLSTASAALVVAGSLGFVGAVAGADPTADNAATAVTSTIPAGSIELNNNTAKAGTDCPDDGFAYWHFVLASTGNGLDFSEIHLELAKPAPGPNDLVTFSGAQLVPGDAGKLNNVWVAVPAGHTVDDIVIENHQSYAFYSGTGTVVNFTLSHICEGTVPSSSTSSSTSSSSTTSSSSSTTSSSTTSSSTTSSSTTSSSTTSSSTTSSSTTSSSTTTPTNPTNPTTAPSTAPATLAQVLGTVQTQPEVAAVQATGALPYTGTDVVLLVVSGLCVLIGGGALVAIARSGRRTSSGS
jgi:LPXTG-motif cell wall-anchored protein